MSGRDDDVAALAVVPPSEYVAARNARAKELRAAKERDRAAAVAALRKPTWTAWALAVLAREEPGVVERFLAAGDALDAAMSGALAGDREPVRDAQAAERAALAEVVAAASAVLAGAGRTAGDQDVQRLTGTLRAAVTDPDVRDRLVRGVLGDDVEAPAFGFGFGAPEGEGDVVALAPRRAARDRSRRAARPRAGSAAPATTDDEGDAAEAAERAAAEAAEQARVEAERRAEQERAAARAELEAEVGRLASEHERLVAAAEAAEEAARAARAAADAAAAERQAAEAALAAVPESTEAPARRGGKRQTADRDRSE